MTGEIFKLLPEAAKKIGAVGKDGKNAQQGYNYRAIDDVFNAIHDVLAEIGITIVPTILDQTREERQTQKGGTLIYSIIRVQYVFYAPDGSSITSSVIGEGMDSGDKASNKAMSAAFKYAVGQVFSIPFSAVDSEQDSHEIKPQNKKETVNDDEI